MENERRDGLRDRLNAAGHGYLFRWFDSLSSDEERSAYLDHLLEMVDLGELERMKLSASSCKRIDLYPPPDLSQQDIQPLEQIIAMPFGEEKQRLWDIGLDEIARGRVAVLLLAGGQGTRLGIPVPKGMMNVPNLPSEKSPFAFQAEKILRLQRLSSEFAREHHLQCNPSQISLKYLPELSQISLDAEPRINWYVMTSDATHKETVQFFHENDHFGLSPDSIHFFCQGNLPCVDESYRLLQIEKNRLQTAPNGNGGLYAALSKHGCLEQMNRQGVRWIFGNAVDNLLVKVADPVFIGLAKERDCDCGCKVVEKKSASEPVGVVCRVKGTPSVVEYCDIGPELSNMRSNAGSLMYNAANVCIHLFSLDFLNHVVADHLQHLPHHVAFKCVPHLDQESGALIQPSSSNGYKFELFIFDVFPFSQRFLALQTDRSVEFSAMKNREGPDSPETCIQDLSRLHIQYARRAGAIVIEHPDPKQNILEISPLLSYEGEELEFLRGREIHLPCYLDKVAELVK